MKNWVTVVTLRSFPSQGVKKNERRMAYYNKDIHSWWLKVGPHEYPRITVYNDEIRVISPLELLAEEAE